MRSIHLTRLLRESGHSVLVVAPTEDDARREFDEELGVVRIDVRKSPAKTAYFCVKAAKYVNSLHQRFDVIDSQWIGHFAFGKFGRAFAHFHTAPTTWIGEIEGLLSAEPSLHSLSQATQWSWLVWAERKTCKVADKIITHSRYLMYEMERFYKIPLSKMDFVYNGVTSPHLALF